MSKARDDVKSIYTAAIQAVNPAAAVSSHVKRRKDNLSLYSQGKKIIEYDLKKFKRIIVVGAGKASASMAREVENLLGDRIDVGCICVKHGYTDTLSKIQIIEASHPVPDAVGMAAARTMLDLLSGADEDDLVISLISGGGSALLPLPPDTITLEEKRATTSLLLDSGASIREMNMLRKHLSLVKGGNMAKAARRATVINLMMSDVVGDDMDVIASGPFVPDNSTYRDALEVLERYGLADRVPASAHAGKEAKGNRL